MQFRALANEDVFYRFSIPNVLSNMGYDIYLVTAPILANDSNATAIQRLPAKFMLRCAIWTKTVKKTPRYL